MTIEQLETSEIKDLRDILLKKQKGICPICEKKINRPCLDHHHKKRLHGSGQIRGVLCSNCNVFLAKSENNSVRYAVKPEFLPSVLRNIADYLEKEPLPYFHPSEKEKTPKLTKSSYNKLKKTHLNYYKDRTNSPKFPEYPKSKTLTVPLKLLFEKFYITPEYYFK